MPSSRSNALPASGRSRRLRRRVSRQLRRPVWRTCLAVVGVALLVGAVYATPAQWLGRLIPGNSVVDSGAVAFRPGDVFITADSVSLEAIDRFDPEGDILFITVSVDSHITVKEWWQASLDNTIELRTRESVFGDRSSQQQRQFNAALMRDSKSTSVIVALEYLGLEAFRSTGVDFMEVVEDSDASGRLVPGDLIIAVDGEPITSVAALVEVIGARSPGTTVVLTVTNFESSESRQEEIVLGSHPEHGGGFIGIGGLQARVEMLDHPFDIDIDSGSVGGPSAGLAFTLSLLDLLTEGELTGGLSVAVTGSISLDGTVGNVGGVLQKATAARRAGSDLLIVPSDLTEQAVLGAGDMAVAGVSSLEEALQVLGSYGGEVTDLTISAG